MAHRRLRSRSRSSLAWILSRASQRLAETLVGRYERKHVDPGGATTGVIVGLKRRETLVSLVQTSVRYVAYVLATLFAITQVAGVGGSGAIAGASLLVLLLGFALQRFLIDILSGVFMQFEGWFAIGDSVVIEPAGPDRHRRGDLAALDQAAHGRR